MCRVETWTCFWVVIISYSYPFTAATTEVRTVSWAWSLPRPAFYWCTPGRISAASKMFKITSFRRTSISMSIILFWNQIYTWNQILFWTRVPNNRESQWSKPTGLARIKSSTSRISSSPWEAAALHKATNQVWSLGLDALTFEKHSTAQHSQVKRCWEHQGA